MKKFFIGLADKLLIIKTDDTEHSFSTHLEGKKINQIAIHPQNENYIFAATNNDGLWRTENGGADWERIGQERGLDVSTITSIAINPMRKKNGIHTIYVGTEPSAMYYSEDSGNKWLEFESLQEVPSKKNWRFPPRPETHFVRWITPSYLNENHLAISIEAGAVLHTENHGISWHDRPSNSPIDVHTLLAHPDKPGYLYAANGDGSSDPKKAYAESSDSGFSWEYMSEGLEQHPYLYHMVLHSNNPKERLVSASQSASKAHRTPRYSTIYKKLHDDPWRELADGLPCEGAYTHHLSEHPSIPGAYYALNNYGLYYLGVSENQWKKTTIDAKKFGFNQRVYSFGMQSNL